MIKMLDFKDWKILKEINIVSMNSYGQELVIGKLLYLREVRKDYYLKEDTEENELLRLLQYPKQELFPHDELDEILLNSIKTQFPNSTVFNSTVSFNSDLKKIETIAKVPKHPATLEVRPDFSQVDVSKLIGKDLNVFIKQINIYQYFTQESITGKYFTGVCDYNRHEEIYNKLETIEIL
jgi:hypothetical protein